MALSVIVSEKEFSKIFDKFKHKWGSDHLNFIGYNENVKDYKNSRRYLTEQSLMFDIKTLKDSLLKG